MSTPGVIGNSLPISGSLDLANINSEFGLSGDLTSYHGAKWYYDGNLTTGNFSQTRINISDFYGKRSTDPANANAYFSNTVGSGSFVVPLYRNTLTIEIWGAGGGGGGAGGNDGAKGSDSSIVSYQLPSAGVVNVTYVAGGGGGGQTGQDQVPAPPLQVTTDRGGGRQPVQDVVRFPDGTVITSQDNKVTAYFDGTTGNYISQAAVDNINKNVGFVE